MPKILSPRNDDNVFDVQSYGATGLGSVDESAAFQAAATAAVAYVASSGGRAVLKISPGKYKLNSPFRIIGGWVTVEAYGAYIYAGVAGQDLFRDWSSQDSSFTLNGMGLQIFGGTWDMRGHSWAQSVEGSSAFTISNSSNLTFKDLTIRNVRSYHGIDINTCKDVMIENVRVEGFKNTYEWKTNVRVASTTSLTLATAYANGQTVDGVILATGDRILLAAQATGAENGIYTVNASGAPTRGTDMAVGSTTAAIDAAVFVTAGTANAGKSFYQSANPCTVNTTAMVWNTYWLLQCKLASTTNLSLTGAATVDGTAVVTGDRILVKNQTTTSQNGIYVASTTVGWSRATDADTAAELNGKSVYVTNGTVAAAGTYKQTATIVNINTDPVTWGSEFRKNRYFSEAIQIDNGPNAIACQNITVNNCYMGPAVDGSGLLSFGKMAGTHTDSSGQFYTNMKFTNNTSVGSLSNAFQGYSFADSIIANNTILGSSERGIRMFFNTGNSGPRLSISNNVITNTVLHGIEIDGGASQLFSDVSITGNTITSTAMTGGSSSTGIHVDTCNQVIVANNLINLASSTSRNQGIYFETVTGGTISGNHITSAGTQAIQIAGSTLVMCSGNTVVNPGDGGIYISALSTSIDVSDNYIIGANQSTTTENGAVCVSTSANTDIVVMGNRVRKGTGTSTQPFKVDSSTVAAVEFNNNSLASDWTQNSYANYSINSANTLCKFIGSDGTHVAALGSDSSSITSTTYVAVTGLSCAIPCPGKYRFKAFLNLTQATAFGGYKVGIGGTTNNSATGAPTATLLTYSVCYELATTGTTSTHATAAYLGNSTTGGTGGTIATAEAVLVDGYIVASTSGTLQIQCASAASGDAVVVKSGSTLIVERIG